MSLTYLWLGEHVKTPGAHFAICGYANQVVSILGSHHVHTVYWVLSRGRGVRKYPYRNQGTVYRCRGNTDKTLCVDIKRRVLLCVQLRTGEFSEQECACCFCCPTRRSVRSTSRPPPGWGETLQTRLTSPLTGGTRHEMCLPLIETSS